MTKEFETLLYLFGDSSLGRKGRITNIENPDVIVNMAVKQGIWSCIHPLMNEICDVKKYHIDFLALVSKSIARNEFTLNILDEAMKTGINICILKGVVVASLYANPDYRISSDTDILINKKDEKKMAKFLLSKGYDVKKRAKNDHHMKAYHKIGGLLEVHISLYSEITDRIIFEDKKIYFEPWQEIDLNGRKFYSLGVNDSLMYLTAHYIKHFIDGGSSIRQMMDLLLYYIKHKDEININRYTDIIKSLRYNRIIETLMYIGAKYFEFDFETGNDEHIKSCAFELLNDCEKCGLFGKSTDKKTSVYDFICYKKDISKIKLKYFMLFKSENNLFIRLFPNQEVLIRYGYTYSKHKILIPFAWIHKLYDHVFKKNNIINNIKNGGMVDERLNLMKQLSVID